MKKLAMLLTLLMLSLVAGADDRKLSPDLRGRHGSESLDVIIQFKHELTPAHSNKVTGRGGLVKAELHLVKAISAQVPARKLADLAEDAEVAYITPDRAVTAHLNNAAPAVFANYGWSLGLDGTGISVAVVDSGIHLLDDLKDSAGKSRILCSAGFIDKGTDDAYGHGTHVAGIISGNAKYSRCSSCRVPIRGIAPNVGVINLRALDKMGRGTDSSVIKAITQALALKDKYNIRILNLSLGRPVYESYTLDPLCQAVEKAWKAGLVVVVAAGNDGRDNSAGTEGYGTINAPGNDPYVITVGAMNTKGTPDRGDDVMTTYSSKGPTAIDHVVKPDIVAPGNRLVSLEQGYLKANYPQNRVLLSYYQNTTNTSTSDKYFVLSGTSMASGVVSGAVALMLQEDPTLTPDQVKARLMKTAYKNFPPYSTVVDSQTGATYTIQYDVFTVGAGYLDVEAALSNRDRADLPAKSPTVRFDEQSGNVYFVRDDSAIWGSGAIWGSSAIWGSNAFVSQQSAIWGSGALWGSAAIWGSSDLAGFSAIWGSSTLWASSGAQTESLSVTIDGEN